MDRLFNCTQILLNNHSGYSEQWLIIAGHLHNRLGGLTHKHTCDTSALKAQTSVPMCLSITAKELGSFCDCGYDSLAFWQKWDAEQPARFPKKNPTQMYSSLPIRSLFLISGGAPEQASADASQSIPHSRKDTSNLAEKGSVSMAGIVWGTDCDTDQGSWLSPTNRNWLEVRQEIQARLYWGPCCSRWEWEQVTISSACSLAPQRIWVGSL